MCGSLMAHSSRQGPNSQTNSTVFRIIKPQSLFLPRQWPISWASPVGGSAWGQRESPGALVSQRGGRSVLSTIPPGGIGLILTIWGVGLTLIPAEMGGDEQDVSPELNIVLAAAAELHLLPPDSEHLLLQEMGFFWRISKGCIDKKLLINVLQIYAIHKLSYIGLPTSTFMWLQNVFPEKSFSPLDNNSSESTLLSRHSKDEKSKHRGKNVDTKHQHKNPPTSVLVSPSMKTDSPNSVEGTDSSGRPESESLSSEEMSNVPPSLVSQPFSKFNITMSNSYWHLAPSTSERSGGVNKSISLVVIHGHSFSYSIAINEKSERRSSQLVGHYKIPPLIGDINCTE